MKNEYTSPELEIIRFTAEDVIVTSISNAGEEGEIGGTTCQIDIK